MRPFVISAIILAVGWGAGSAQAGPRQTAAIAKTVIEIIAECPPGADAAHRAAWNHANEANQKGSRLYRADDLYGARAAFEEALSYLDDPAIRSNLADVNNEIARRDAARVAHAAQAQSAASALDAAEGHQ